MRTNDIIKGVIYDRGEAVLNGEKRYLSLVALIVASDKPIASDNEIIVMGSANVSDELLSLTKYKCPYKFGDISDGILGVSDMTPDELEIL